MNQPELLIGRTLLQPRQGQTSCNPASLNDQFLESDFVFYQRTVTGAFAMPLLEHQGVDTLAETLPYNSHL